MLKLIGGIVIATMLGGTLVDAQVTRCFGGALIDSGRNARVIGIELVHDTTGWRLTQARSDADYPVARATSIQVTGNQITVTIAPLDAEYRGTIGPAGRRIRGTWTDHGKSVGVDLGCTLDAPLDDRSPHTAKFVSVEKNVVLEVLDWGGMGRPLVLIHGKGTNAHDFDDFAPKLAASYHVYGITRRGAGRSSVPDGGYDGDRFGDDVVAVLDSLRIPRAVLVGHSMGGAELSSVATRHPNRAAGLVYLDAAYWYAFLDSARKVEKLDESFPCPCTVSEKMDMGIRGYRSIPVPALAIYAVDDTWDRPRDNDFTLRVQAAEFERDNPKARVVRIEGARHDVFRSNEATVLTEMKAFIDRLPVP